MNGRIQCGQFKSFFLKKVTPMATTKSVSSNHLLRIGVQLHASPQNLLQLLVLGSFFPRGIHLCVELLPLQSKSQQSKRS